MRISLVICSLFVSVGARAAVTCSTPDLTMQMSIVLPSGDVLGDAAAGFALSAADCQCHSNDLKLRLQIESAIPMTKANGQLQVWIGSGCDNPIARSQTCQLITDSGINYNQFVVGTVESAAAVELTLPTDALFGNTCAPFLLSNNLYLLFAPDGDLDHASVCEVPLQENNQAPTAVMPTATPDVGAVNVQWTAAAGLGEAVPFSYQLLCADAEGNPLPGRTIDAQAYSVCKGGAISRRNTLPVVGGMPSAAPIASPTTTLDALDPAFRCSDEIRSSALDFAVRVDRLEAGKTYQFVVAAIDIYGNATPSQVVVASTPPAMDPPAHGCAYVPHRAPDAFALIALSVLALALTRRRLNVIVRP